MRLWIHFVCVFCLHLCWSVIFVRADCMQFSALRSLNIATNCRCRCCYHSTPCLKNVPPLACCNFYTHEWILILFGRNVTDKLRNQKTFYCATSNNVCFYTIWQHGETRKSHFHSVGLCYKQRICALSSRKKKLSSVMCLIASNIC